MDSNTEYLQRIGYRQVGRLLIGKMLIGISYVDRQPDQQGNYWRLAFLPYSTLALEVSENYPVHAIVEIETHAATIIARRGERFELSSSDKYVILGEEDPDSSKTD